MKRLGDLGLVAEAPGLDGQYPEQGGPGPGLEDLDKTMLKVLTDGRPDEPIGEGIEALSWCCVRHTQEKKKDGKVAARMLCALNNV